MLSTLLPFIVLGFGFLFIAYMLWDMKRRDQRKIRK